MGRENQGFASMDPAVQREIASAGGKKARDMKVAHRWKRGKEAQEAGRQGGIASALARKKRREEIDDL
jgi:general stress protein YciG